MGSYVSEGYEPIWLAGSPFTEGFAAYVPLADGLYSGGGGVGGSI